MPQWYVILRHCAQYRVANFTVYRRRRGAIGQALGQWVGPSIHRSIDRSEFFTRTSDIM